MKLTAKVQRSLERRQPASTVKTRIYNTLKEWKNYWSNEWQTVSHARLYAASAVSAAVLIGTSYVGITHIQNTTAWKEVFSNGTYVGMVPNDPKVIQAMDRVALGYHVDVRFHNVNTFVPDSYDWASVASLPTPAIAITLNGSPVVYTKDSASADRVLAMVQKALTPASLGDNASVHFSGNIGYSPVVVSVSHILSDESAVRYILHPTPDKLAGRSESLNGMVAHAGIKHATLNSAANALKPLLEVTAHKTVTRTVSIPFNVKYIKDNHLGKGKLSVVTPGKQGQAKEQISLNYVNGQLVSQTVVQKDVTAQPVTEVAKQGTNAGVASGSWGWPSAAYDITSPFGYRSLGGGEFHPGVDIGCSIGTPVYATNNGVVEDAGWNSGGYGIWAKISNGDGIETVFGHMSRVVVHAGQTVAKGQVIGYSGATGNVTGPHLHYEVRMYGRAIPPTPYM